MSQQQQMPEPQEQGRSELSDQVQEARYYTRNSVRTSGPKEEHPATFEDKIPPYSYSAQDRVTYTREESRQHITSSRQSGSYQQVPPWSRTQRKGGVRKILPILGIIVLALLLIKVLPFLLVLLVGIIGLSLFVILLPLLIIVGIVLALGIIALVVMAMLGISFRRNGTNVRRGRPWI